MSKVENCKFKDSGKVDIEQSLSESEFKRLVILRTALERIVSQEVYEKYPSEDCTHEEMGRYVWPERMKAIREIAVEALAI